MYFVAIKMGRCWGSVSAYQRVGVWAFEKCHQLRRNLLVMIAASKNCLTSNPPTRSRSRGTDTPKLFPTIRAAEF
jgi:hypothetical protein